MGCSYRVNGAGPNLSVFFKKKLNLRQIGCRFWRSVPVAIAMLPALVLFLFKLPVRSLRFDLYDRFEMHLTILVLILIGVQLARQRRWRTLLRPVLLLNVFAVTITAYDLRPYERSRWFREELKPLHAVVAELDFVFREQVPGLVNNSVAQRPAAEIDRAYLEIVSGAAAAQCRRQLDLPNVISVGSAQQGRVITVCSDRLLTLISSSVGAELPPFILLRMQIAGTSIIVAVARVSLPNTPEKLYAEMLMTRRLALALRMFDEPVVVMLSSDGPRGGGRYGRFVQAARVNDAYDTFGWKGALRSIGNALLMRRLSFFVRGVSVSDITYHEVPTSLGHSEESLAALVQVHGP